tara:strand:- start:41 stop:1060 length:1020 start_codon:yes stop_codon:yes gene_type:complete
MFSGEMRKLVIITCVIMVFSGAFTTSKVVPFSYPDNWPVPAYDFEKNPRTQEGFALGRKLFNDPKLSADNTIACSSCHLSFTGFTHADHSLSHGIKGRIGTRNSSSLINLAWNKSFNWDGGSNNIEVQAITPITHHVEMDNDLLSVVEYLNSSKEYRASFYNAFGDSVINSQKLLKALAQFTLSLTSFESKYDSIYRKEPGVQFSPKEEKGYQLFLNNCNSCHTQPLFTNNGFEDNGLSVDKDLNDLGRYEITKEATDSFKFKVPTLRNIANSAPYFHDGRVNTLKDVMKHYTTSITDRNSLSNHLKGNLKLSREEQIQIVAFLKTLTDKSFLYNINFR